MRYLAAGVAFVTFWVTSHLQAADEPQLPSKESFHLFLLAGQSNMVGRGRIEDQDRKPHPRIIMLSKESRWTPAVDPMHFDKPNIVGVGLGRAFGAHIANADPHITVGLIPCAVGGLPIASWEPGGHHKQTDSHPYDDAVRRVKFALKYGTLKGILWHQGESDSVPEKAEVYERNLHELITRLRKQFNAPDVPFIVGQMGQFKRRPWNDAKKLVDTAHRTLPNKLQNTAFVHAKGLKHKGDQVHFEAASYREFGRRYAIVYREMRVLFPKDQLDSVAKSFVGRLGFYAKDLSSEATYAWHADDRYPPASVIKLPVMVELYRQAAAGKFDLNERRLLPDDISTHGTGDLKRRDGPVELSLREYCRLMMVQSDNTVTDFVMRTVGMGEVNSFLGEQGLKDTRVAMEIGRWHYVIVGMIRTPISRENDGRLIARVKAGAFDNDGLGYSDSVKNNVCGPRDIVLLLERLYLQQLAAKSATAEMLDMMASSTHKQTISRYIREGVRVSNKYGGSQRIAADAGIIELPGRPIVIAGFTLSDDASTQIGHELLARMSRLIIATIDPDAVTAID